MNPAFNKHNCEYLLHRRRKMGTQDLPQDWPCKNAGQLWLCLENRPTISHKSPDKSILCLTVVHENQMRAQAALQSAVPTP
mmetsp:Transcript_77470/g.129303  ORF Transcript_77470/g.129303 Transcript_77470/m.129303 type:complete len:81 (+) Transcript_77470:277-519(+)